MARFAGTGPNLATSFWPVSGLTSPRQASWAAAATTPRVAVPAEVIAPTSAFSCTFSMLRVLLARSSLAIARSRAVLAISSRVRVAFSELLVQNSRMGLAQQAVCFPVSIEVEHSDWELDDSLRKIGLLRPILVWDGKVIDGRRRMDAARRITFEVRELQLPTRIDAARALYRIHPRRAFMEFAHPGISRTDLAYLFGVSKTALPTFRQLRVKSRQERGVAFYRGEDTAFIGGIPIARRKLEAAKQACRERGISFSAWVRGQIDTELLRE